MDFLNNLTSLLPSIGQKTEENSEPTSPSTSESEDESSEQGKEEIEEEDLRNSYSVDLSTKIPESSHSSQPSSGLELSDIESRRPEPPFVDDEIEAEDQFILHEIKSPGERTEIYTQQLPSWVESYLEGTTEVITRAKFVEFVEWSQSQQQRLSQIALEAGDRERCSMELYRKERTERVAVEKSKDTANSLSSTELDAMRRSDRGKPRAPRPLLSFRASGMPDGLSFIKRLPLLYENLADGVLEVNAKLILARAQSAIIRRQWENAEILSQEAFKAAERLDYEPLQARCLYWRGVAEFERGDYSTAWETFGGARSCQGVYREGAKIDQYLNEIESKLSKSNTAHMF